MKKILKIWNRAAEWLCGFGSDKWVHFVVGAIISFAIAWILMATTEGATELETAFCVWRADCRDGQRGGGHILQ